MTLSLVVYPIAFNLGAFGQVFYTDLFRFVVAATAGLGESLLATPYSGRRRWLANGALASPALWLLLAVVVTDSTSDAATDPILGPLALVVALVSIPTVPCHTDAADASSTIGPVPRCIGTPSNHVRAGQNHQ